MSLPNFKLLRPRTVEQAVTYLTRYGQLGEMEILAGGTDLVPSLKQRLFTPKFVMDVRGIEELSKIKVVPGDDFDLAELLDAKFVMDVRGIEELSKIKVVPGHAVEIGALTTLSTIEDSGFIQRDYPVLHEAVKTVASPILRNMGTLGGNICLDTRCLWYNQSLQWRRSCGFCIKKDGDLCH